MSTPYYFTGMLTPGIGKEVTVLQWFSHNPIGIVHVISREEIESINLGGMLEFLGPHIDIKSLRRLRGKVHFAISGYDMEAKELYEIPEVRSFFEILHRTWPAWIYAASPASPSLLVIALATCPNLSILRTAHSLSVEVNPRDMRAFHEASLHTAWLLKHITNVSDKSLIKQVHTIAAYLSVEL